MFESSALTRILPTSQITSVFNVAVSLVLQEYIGPLGLVVANCFAMSIRISYTLCYIRFIRFSWTSEAFLPAIMPKAPFVADVRNLCAHNRDVKNSYRHTYFQRCAYLADHFDGAFEIRAIVFDDDSSVDEKGYVIFLVREGCSVYYV